MTDNNVVKSLKSAIISKRPVFGEVLQQYGSMSLYEYVRTISPVLIQESDSKQGECIDAICTEAEQYFNSDEVLSIRSQLKENFTVSTAEHHGPFVHPFFVHANLLAATLPVENIISLAVGNVSLNNSSYPRGIFFRDAGGVQSKISFFRSSERHVSVFQSRPIREPDIGLEHVTGPIQALLKEVYTSEKMNTFDLYSQQITHTNILLWQGMFAKSINLPRLVNLQIEDVVLRLILKHHVYAQTAIHDMLFDPLIRARLEQSFDGIPGAFTKQAKKGTFLFWLALPGAKKKEALWLSGASLVSASGYAIALEPQAIAEALERRELIPSTALSLVVLSCYYGLKCLGGFSQGTYLTALAQAYHAIFGTMSESNTKGFLSDIVLAYARLHGALVPASGIDIYVYHDSESWKKFIQSTKNLTLEDGVAPLFPELYSILHSRNERESLLSQCSIEDIYKHYSLEDKIVSCIEIK